MQASVTDCLASIDRPRAGATIGALGALGPLFRQVTGSDGTVTFTTIYPGWYTPRVTHIHLMVYNPSDLTTPVKTTQLCLPDAINETVYGQAGLASY